MKRSTKAAQVKAPKKKLVVRKTKVPASFKTADWYATAARSFGLSMGEGATPREVARIRNR
jgi:hypothetical protein